MAAARAVLADEVQVPAAHLDALGVGREPKTHHRSLDVGESEHVLIRDDLGERPVRGLLAGNRTGLHQREAPVDPNRAGDGVGRDPHFDRREQRIVIRRFV